MGEKRKATEDPPGHPETTDTEKQVSKDTLEKIMAAPPEDDAARDGRFANLYAKAPDFKQLALQDPDFARLWNQHKTDFFNDPECVMQLTKTLLKLDFGLKIELPHDRLCPPVTNRHNYLLWIKSLMDTTSYEKPGRKLVGLDIGTGASCIYPLLGCTQRPWSFIATGQISSAPLTKRYKLTRPDIDAKSLEYAQKNISLNNLQHRITLLSRNPTDALIPLDEDSKIDFTMTNPPFYESELEMVKSAEQKSRPPFTACTGSKTEMITPGGEASFVDRILRESLSLRGRVQWYTAMFGFLSSLVDFVGKLREHGVDNYAVTELVQGSKTRRWVVGWSFGAMRPAQDVARGVRAAAVAKSVLPEATEEKNVVEVPLPEKVGSFVDSLTGEIEKLDLVSWEWDRERMKGVGRAADRVWARAWRRKKKREMETGKKESAEEAKCVFAFEVSVRVARDSLSVGCRWVEGHDAVAFESFRGYLKKTARAILSDKTET
ncbi:hypothetical protein ACJ41O_000892 [Fusarium nematophilum]